MVSQKILQVELLHGGHQLQPGDKTGVGGGVLLGLPGAKKALYLPEAGIDLIGVGVAKGGIKVELPVLPVLQCLPGQSIRLLPVFLLTVDEAGGICFVAREAV